MGRFESWLLGTRARIPAAISAQLTNGLFASVPIFLGGIANTSAVAALAAWRHPTAPFIGWLVFEIVLGVARLAILLHGRREIAAGRTPPRIFAALLSCAWAGSAWASPSLWVAGSPSAWAAGSLSAAG